MGAGKCVFVQSIGFLLKKRAGQIEPLTMRQAVAVADEGRKGCQTVGWTVKVNNRQQTESEEVTQIHE